MTSNNNNDDVVYTYVNKKRRRRIIRFHFIDIYDGNGCFMCAKSLFTCYDIKHMYVYVHSVMYMEKALKIFFSSIFFISSSTHENSDIDNKTFVFYEKKYINNIIKWVRHDSETSCVYVCIIVQHDFYDDDDDYLCFVCWSAFIYVSDFVFGK